MRILVVTQYFWPEQFRVNDLVVGLRERGHEVTVLTGQPNYPGGRFYPGYGLTGPTKEKFSGAEINRVPLLPRGSRQGIQLALNYLSFVIFACLLGPFRCRGQFDLVLVFEPSPVTVALPGLVMGWTKQAPTWLWVQDLWPESLRATGVVRSERILAWVRRLVRFIYKRCDLVLVQAESFRPMIVAEGKSPEAIRYFPNWAESLYRLLGPQQRKPDLPDGFVLMFAGNIGTAQSFETILEAADRLRTEPKIQWVIIGDGSQRAVIKQKIEEFGLQHQVRMLGSKPVEQMPEYFAQADALLVTLRKDPIFSLTIPSKLQSYLACGRPIVGSLDGEGAKVIRESGAGFAVPAGDGTALAEAVSRIYRIPKEEREAMGRRGRAYFEREFERERLLDRLEGWMRESREAAPA